MKTCCILVLAFSLGLRAQETAAASAASDAEKRELAVAIQEANTSAMDTIAALETHLAKHPATPLRLDIYKYLAKASIEAKDDARTVRYGVPVNDIDGPMDINLLDRTAGALLRTGGKENAGKALAYAKRIEDYVIRVPVPSGGPDAAKNQEDHDRIVGRTLLYQARAQNILGDFDDARRKAALAFLAYPDTQSSREQSDAWEHMGRHQEAIERLADAFAIPDPRATVNDRAADRKRLGELYKKLHGDEKGLGDEILAAYDRTSVAVEKELSQLRALDPNMGVTDPMKFTLEALGGGKLNLAALRGKVVIFDFWATWCAPCIAQHPLYEEVKKRFRDRDDVLFLSVDTDEDHAPVDHFLADHKWTGTVYFDSGMVNLMAINSIPSTMIADKTGRMVSRMDGYLEDRFVDQLTARIKAALGVIQ